MLARGAVVSYETIRAWCAKFGQAYANQLRRRRAQPGDRWHLDEVFIRINGTIHYLWRAVDQHGDVLDILVQSRRNAKAAKKFFRKLLKGLRYVPRVLVTDKLRSYGVAHREVMPSVQHRQSKYLNNRAENSHQPTRQRERAMKRSPRRACATVPVGVQRHLAAFPSASASAVGHRMAPRDGRPLHCLGHFRVFRGWISVRLTWGSVGVEGVWAAPPTGASLTRQGRFASRSRWPSTTLTREPMHPLGMRKGRSETCRGRRHSPRQDKPCMSIIHPRIGSEPRCGSSDTSVGTWWSGAHGFGCVSKGLGRACYGRTPRASRALRVASRWPSATLDPRASVRPSGQAKGAGQRPALATGAAQNKLGRALRNRPTDMTGGPQIFDLRG